MKEATAARGRANQVRPRLSKQMRTDLLGYLFCAPWILAILIFTAYPTLASFYFSFHKYNVVQPPRFLGLGNYITMFTRDPRLLKSIYNTLYLALLGVPLSMVSSLALAVILNSRVRLVGFYRTLYYLPALVPPVAGTLLWMLIMDPRQGLMNAALYRLGLPRLGWFQDPNWSKPALLIMSMWGVGSGTLIYLASLKDVPHELLEAATIDGANAWRRFRSITIPMISPVILFNLVMAIIGIFGTFTNAFVAGSSETMSGGGPSGTAGGPLDSLLVYMLYLYAQAFRYFEMGYASAMAVLLFLVITCLTLLIFASSGRWVYYEGGLR